MIVIAAVVRALKEYNVPIRWPTHSLAKKGRESNVPIQ